MRYLPSFENVRNLEIEALKYRIKTGGTAFDGFKNKIELDCITFQYDKTQVAALNNVRIVIPKGQMIALVGKSGSGKSTLADIVMGFHQAQQGQFTIDDVSFEKIDIHSYRDSIGYVPQQSSLFNTSIRENLLWAYPQADDNAVKQACDNANCSEFIEKLPDGLDTLVGDRGVRLSGGQVQRLAIARAILRKPAILVLDDATSALDSESEKQIQNSKYKLDLQS